MHKKLLTVLWLGWLSVAAHAQSTNAFTYQGRLNLGGTPATGQFDLQFSLFDAATAGIQYGITQTNLAAPVTNGLFTATLDFGSAVFSGNPRWLEIAVHGPGDTNYTTLTPRQALTPTPYAIRAANFSGSFAATNLTGKIPDTQLSTNVALLSSNAIFARSVTASNFNGSGYGLINLPAASLTGTVPDARLSANIARLNNNANFAGSITATQFNGNGKGLTNVPGRIFEVIPTATNIQALANTGYLATNPTRAVVVTLPITANIRVGETVRVSGSGAGGWVVAQNAGQSILIGTLLDSLGQNWTLRDSSRAWRGVASSADGSKLLAAANGGFIYTSTDYGMNWTARDSSRNWRAVASSGDGVKLAAAVNGGFIYTSTDSGTNWTPRFGSVNWSSIASSLNGAQLVASFAGGQLYTSSDSGTNWTQRTPGNLNWASVASSDNGVNLVAAIQGGQLYTSSNSGTNWTPRESNRNWISVASSGDGSRLVAAENGGAIYVSTDFGTNWFATSALNLAWTSVTSSADGAQMAAVYNLGGRYLSEDSGLSWVQRLPLPNTVSWTAVTMSSDASTLVAVGNPSQIYVSSQATTTTGTAGSLRGARLAAVELIHCGNGVFMPISNQGTIRAK
ncbi:MAG: hypothetical protein KBH45_08640 [Verrucomicrobia bacterium]|nr:hypothetical protein [Verrucomicrobiota bacterium]